MLLLPQCLETITFDKKVIIFEKNEKNMVQYLAFFSRLNNSTMSISTGFMLMDILKL